MDNIWNKTKCNTLLWIDVFLNFKNSLFQIPEEHFNKEIFSPMIYHIMLFGYINAGEIFEWCVNNKANKIHTRRLVNQFEIDARDIAGHFD